MMRSALADAFFDQSGHQCNLTVGAGRAPGVTRPSKCPASAVQGSFMHFIEGAIHQTCKIALDRKLRPMTEPIRLPIVLYFPSDTSEPKSRY